MTTPDQPRSTPTRSGLLAAGSFILVVDDDPSMRVMIETVLRGNGWAVKSADGAESAIAIIESASVAPVLLVCDVMMNGVDGFELTRRLLTRQPGLKAILISAHVADVSWWPNELRDCPFLSKPFANDQLISAVRDALAG